MSGFGLFFDIMNDFSSINIGSAGGAPNGSPDQFGGCG